MSSKFGEQLNKDKYFPQKFDDEMIHKQFSVCTETCDIPIRIKKDKIKKIKMEDVDER